MTTVKDLAKSLSDRHDIKQKDAEKFINTFIDVLNDSLHFEHLVKVKGLGTFKVTPVRERESVNVNTGERVVIEGHDKISFVPDTVMRDLVNKPFAQFETVVVNDGVDFADIDANDASNMENDDDADNNVTPSEDETDDAQEGNNSDTVAEPTELLNDESQISESITPASEETASEREMVKDEIITEQIISEDIPVEQPIEVESKSNEDVSEGNIEESLEDTQDAPAEPSTNKETDIDEVNQENETETDKSDEVETITENNTSNEVHHHYKWILTVIIALFICVASFVFGYYMGNGKSSTTATPKQEKNVNIAVKPNKPKIKVANVEKSKPSESKPIAKDNNLKSKEDEESVLSQKYDKMDNRVRTGAYKIVGVDKVVKVKAHQTISSISTTYLGPHMECYVEVMNDCKEIKEGQKLNIPKLQLRHKK